MTKRIPKIAYLLLCLLLITEQSGLAQVAAELNIAGYLNNLQSAAILDKYRPIHLRYLSYDVSSNSFNLLLDRGNLKELKETTLKESAQKLLEYFFVGITLPNESFWVNLRPDSPDNIIDGYLAMTDAGRVLLEADLQLKKDTAKLTNPQNPLGKEYWKRLYQKAEELLGYENLTIPTLVRPWIVPDEIIIRETESNAYIYKATLKVMLEEDYLKNSQAYSFQDPRLKTLNEYSSELIRELIIPSLNKEINTSKRYAALRQLYYSLILAQWFKSRFYGKGGLYSWLINKKDLSNLASKKTWDKNTYFKEYQDSFKNGEYNLKEPINTPFGRSVRSYFSGGMAFDSNAVRNAITTGGRIIVPEDKPNTVATISKIGFVNTPLIEMSGEGSTNAQFPNEIKLKLTGAAGSSPMQLQKEDSVEVSKRLQKLRERLAEAEEVMQAKENQRENAKRELLIQRQEHETQTNLLKKYSDQEKGTEKLIKERRSLLAGLQRELDQIRENLPRRANHLQRIIPVLEKRIAELERKLESQQETLRLTRANLSRIKKELVEKEKGLSDAEKEFQEATKRLEIIRSNYEELAKKLPPEKDEGLIQIERQLPR